MRHNSSAILVCQNSFLDGQTSRLKHPLHMGVYKLREAREVLLRFIGTIDAIAPAPRAGPNGLVRLFGCCTSDDAGVWLKALPAQIAFT